MPVCGVVPSVLQGLGGKPMCLLHHLQVTPESLLLHYYSSRPGLWPIVAGVLKGISKDYFKLDLQVELLQSREKGDCDHEV